MTRNGLKKKYARAARMLIALASMLIASGPLLAQDTLNIDAGQKNMN